MSSICSCKGGYGLISRLPSAPGPTCLLSYLVPFPSMLWWSGRPCRRVGKARRPSFSGWEIILTSSLDALDERCSLPSVTVVFFSPKRVTIKSEPILAIVFCPAMYRIILVHHVPPNPLLRYMVYHVLKKRTSGSNRKFSILNPREPPAVSRHAAWRKGDSS